MPIEQRTGQRSIVAEFVLALLSAGILIAPPNGAAAQAPAPGATKGKIKASTAPAGVSTAPHEQPRQVFAYDLMQNPFKYQHSVVLLDPRYFPLIVNHVFRQYQVSQDSVSREYCGLRFEKMLNQDMAVYSIIASEQDPESGWHGSIESIGHLLVAIADAAKLPDTVRVWRVEPLGTTKTTNGFGAREDTPTVKFLDYWTPPAYQPPKMDAKEERIVEIVKQRITAKEALLALDPEWDPSADTRWHAGRGNPECPQCWDVGLHLKIRNPISYKEFVNPDWAVDTSKGTIEPVGGYEGGEALRYFTTDTTFPAFNGPVAAREADRVAVRHAGDSDTPMLGSAATLQADRAEERKQRDKEQSESDRVYRTGLEKRAALEEKMAEMAEEQKLEEQKLQQDSGDASNVEAVTAFELQRNPYRYKNKLLWLNPEPYPVLLNGMPVMYSPHNNNSIALGFLGLRFDKMLDAHRALYYILGQNVNGPRSSALDTIGQLAVLLDSANNGPLRLDRTWHLEGLGVMEGTNGFGAPVAVPLVRFRRYRGDRAAQPANRAPYPPVTTSTKTSVTTPNHPITKPGCMAVGAKTKLNGTVRLWEGYSSSWTFAPDRPICIEGSTLERIQLFDKSFGDVFRSLKNKAMTISGTLISPDPGSANWKTPYAVNVDSIRTPEGKTIVPTEWRPSLPAHNLQNYRATFTVDINPKRITREASTSSGQTLIPGDTYVSYNPNRPLDFAWIGCAEGFEISDYRENGIPTSGGDPILGHPVGLGTRRVTATFACQRK